jgi:hypothetical protein
VGLAWAAFGGVSVTLQRKVNGRFVPRPEHGPVSVARLQEIHLRLIILDFLRGVGLVLAGWVVARTAMGVLAADWPLALANTIALLTTGGAVSLGALVRRQGEGTSTRALFVGGVAVGLIMAAVL